MQAAIARHYKLVVCKEQELIVTVVEAGKSKTKAPAGSVSGEGPLPGSGTAGPHTVKGCRSSLGSL